MSHVMRMTVQNLLHIKISHVAHRNTSCRTYECVMTHIWTSHFTQIIWRFEWAHCNTLQHSARHCNTLQYTYNTRKELGGSCQVVSQTWNSTLQHTATHCNTLQHTATHCNILQHTAPHITSGSAFYLLVTGIYIMSYLCLQHTATHCDTLQHILNLVVLSTCWSPTSASWATSVSV